MWELASLVGKEGTLIIIYCYDYVVFFLLVFFLTPPFSSVLAVSGTRGCLVDRTTFCWPFMCPFCVSFDFGNNLFTFLTLTRGQER